jgi:hypothetical protein
MDGNKGKWSPSDGQRLHGRVGSTAYLHGVECAIAWAEPTVAVTQMT